MPNRHGANNPITIPETPASEAAIAYRRLGWGVLPVAGKGPHFDALKAVHGIVRWSAKAVREASDEEVRRWFDLYPEAGLGIMTGPLSGIVVVDIDRKPRGLRLIETPIVRSARGLHVYLDSEDAPKAVGRCGIDVKAQGGYVVAPPSRHPNGTTFYRWTIGPPGLGNIFLPEAPPAPATDFNLYVDLAAGKRPKSQARSASTRSRSRSTSHKKTYVSLARPHVPFDAKGWDRYEPFVQKAMKLCGITAKIGAPFLCVLPGHAERNPSANIWRGDDGVFTYRDHHGAKHTNGTKATDAYPLSAVYAAVVSGKIERLSKAELAVWHLRLLVRTGFVSAASVNAPTAPDDLSATERTLYMGFVELLSLRRLMHPDTEVFYSGRFAARWCGLSEHHARKGITELLARNLILTQDHPTKKTAGKPWQLCRLPSDTFTDTT